MQSVIEDLNRSTSPVMVAVGEPRVRTASAGVARLRRLRAVLLLDGTVRRSPFAEAIDRSLLELPLDAKATLLDLWRNQVAVLSQALELPRMRTRIIVGHNTRAPVLRPEDHDAGISVETDPTDLRGTGGVLRDVADEYDEDDTLLVANGAQLLVEPLHALVVAAAQRGGEVTVAANGDGTPCSLTLLSCRALRQLPRIGFVDLKEQGLAAMAKSLEVTTLWRGSAAGLPIRTPRDYLAAVRAQHRLGAGSPALEEAFAERWQKSFALVEEGATVAREATLHDCVVLRGAQVGSGALVADSIVCGGGSVRPRENVLRRVVGARRRMEIEPNTR